LFDMLSEHSQIKSSESIDDILFHEKLAYLMATDATTNKSLRLKLFNSIKRRLSMASSKRLASNSEKNETDRKTSNPNNETTSNELNLSEAEKEHLRKQLDFYHKHYLEHTMQQKKMSEYESNLSSSGKCNKINNVTNNNNNSNNSNNKNNDEFSFFKFRVSKAQLRRMIGLKEEPVKQPTLINRTDSNFSSGCSYNSSFKNANGSVPQTDKSSIKRKQSATVANKNKKQTKTRFTIFLKTLLLGQ
jgi:hypothetical protein